MKHLNLKDLIGYDWAEFHSFLFQSIILLFYLDETHIFKKWEKWGLANCLPKITLKLLGANNSCEWEPYTYGLSTHLLEKAEKSD